jgi:hypothetical protein
VRSVAQKIALIEGRLMRKEQIVHLPEVVLCTGRLGCFCRLLSVRMFVEERKVPKDVSKVFPHLLQQCLDDGIDLSAIRTFKIAIGEQCGRRGVRSFDVIPLVYDEVYWWFR